MNANGVTTFPFTLPEFGSNKSDDEVVDEVCYIGKAKCNCLKGCKCKARTVQLNLFDPAVVSDRTVPLKATKHYKSYGFFMCL